jgi:hypothetical protein
VLLVPSWHPPLLDITLLVARRGGCQEGAVDLYISGRMLGSKENLDLMLSSSQFLVVGLVLLNDARRKERK